jgi:hypothetical protein
MELIYSSALLVWSFDEREDGLLNKKEGTEYVSVLLSQWLSEGGRVGRHYSYGIKKSLTQEV